MAMTSAHAGVLNISPFEVFSEPFPYAVSARAFDDGVSTDILAWLESEAPWKLVETGFYEQFEFSFVDAVLPAGLTFLREQTFIDSLASEIRRLFGVSLSGRVDATAHRLLPGQRIRIHNDFIPEAETHRLLIQLNRRWRDEDGGFLLFFNSPDPADVHKVLRPVHNRVVAFAISPDSHHAVTTVHGGERYTLIYSFYAEK
jgi:Rps23 Pro-64 3,4-dihydroxylase Tpa1-like proline 4-hydroxylase